jgi:hypothetical protein
MKKVLVAIVPVAALAAVAIAPVWASADTVVKCPKGVTNRNYCTKTVECKVPQLKGKTPGQAGTLLRQHDCKLGKTTKAAGSGVPKGRILRSSPSAGTVHISGFKVNIIVRK